MGYGVTNSDLAKKIRRVTRPYHINSVAIAAANLALDSQSFIDTSIEKNQVQIEKIASFCQRKDIHFIQSHANFIAIHLGESAIKITRMLDQQNIKVSSLDNYGFIEWIRVTTGTPQQVDAFLKALQEVLEAEKLSSCVAHTT